MKLTKPNIDKIVNLIESMRGKITRERIEARVSEKMFSISSRQLFDNPEIKRAYESAKQRRRAATISLPIQAPPENAAETIRTQANKIASLEERLSIVFYNAEKLGIPTHELLISFPALKLGNTYPQKR